MTATPPMDFYKPDDAKMEPNIVSRHLLLKMYGEGKIHRSLLIS